MARLSLKSEGKYLATNYLTMRDRSCVLLTLLGVGTFSDKKYLDKVIFLVSYIRRKVHHITTLAL